MTDDSRRFGAQSTADDVAEGVDLSSKTVVVTGGGSGIGLETARVLARRGAAVVVAARDVARAEAAVGALDGAVSRRIECVSLDLSDLSSVAAFVARWDRPLDILINNAGVMAVQELTRSREGFELQFATNHLGHFALSVGLRDALSAASSARIVSVSSSGHLLSPVVFDDIHFRFRVYDPFAAYGQSKTANVLFAVEAQRRWSICGITTNALHPGGIATNLQRHVGGLDYMERADERFRRAGSSLKTIAQGAATSVYLAVSPVDERGGSTYYEDCAPAERVERRNEDTLGGVAGYALDPENAKRLWNISEELTQVRG